MFQKSLKALSGPDRRCDMNYKREEIIDSSIEFRGFAKSITDFSNVMSDVLEDEEIYRSSLTEDVKAELKKIVRMLNLRKNPKARKWIKRPIFYKNLPSDLASKFPGNHRDAPGYAGYFKVTGKKSKTTGYFQVSIVGGTLYFREATGSYNVSDTYKYKKLKPKKDENDPDEYDIFVDKVAVDKVFALVLMGATHIKKRDGHNSIKFSAAEASRVNIYRRMIRKFADTIGNFMAYETGQIAKAVILDRKGNPAKDEPRSRKKSGKVRLKAGDEVTLLSTADKDTYRIVRAGDNIKGNNVPYAELEPRVAANMMARTLGGRSFNLATLPPEQLGLTGKADEVAIVDPIEGINDMPDTTFVIGFKRRNGFVAEIFALTGHSSSGKIRRLSKESVRVFKNSKTDASKSLKIAVARQLSGDRRAGPKDIPDEMKRLFKEKGADQAGPEFLGKLRDMGVNIETPEIRGVLMKQVHYKFKWYKYGLKNAVLGDLIAKRLYDKPPTFKRMTYKGIMDMLAGILPPIKDR